MEVCSKYMFGKLMQKDDLAIREIVPSLIRLGRVFSYSMYLYIRYSLLREHFGYISVTWGTRTKLQPHR